MIPSLEIFRVIRDDPRAWGWMPAVLDRVSNFARQYETEATPLEVMELVRLWFAAGDPRLGLWVAIFDGTVVGHILANPTGPDILAHGDPSADSAVRRERPLGGHMVFWESLTAQR